MSIIIQSAYAGSLKVSLLLWSLGFLTCAANAQVQVFIAPEGHLAMGANKVDRTQDTLDVIRNPLMVRTGYGLAAGVRWGGFMARACINRYFEESRVRSNYSVETPGNRQLFFEDIALVTPTSYGLNVSMDFHPSQPRLYAGLGFMVNRYNSSSANFTSQSSHGNGGKTVTFDVRGSNRQALYAAQVFAGMEQVLGKRFKVFEELGYNHSPDFSVTNSITYDYEGKKGSAASGAAFRHVFITAGVGFMIVNQAD